MKYYYLFHLFLIVLILPECAIAGKIDFNGYGAAGYSIYDREYMNKANQEAYYEAKIQADIKISDEIEAQLDLRGKSSDYSVNFREFSIKFDFFEYCNVKVGNIKKPFGYDQMINREELITIERSYVQNKMADLGYGGRNISIMAYNKYSKKDEEFPFTYLVSLFKDNSSGFGFGTRLRYHIGKTAFGVNYLMQKTGSTPSAISHGIAADFAIEKKKYTNSLEFFLVQDPVEELRRRAINNDLGTDFYDLKTYAAGAKLLTAYKFDADYKFLKNVQPMLLLSFYQPDIDINQDHVIQALLGVNMFIHEDVALRLNVDLRFNKNRYNSSYNTHDSRFIFEIQAKY